MKKLDRAFALTGVLFVVAIVAVFVWVGSTPDSHDSASTVVSFFAKHHHKLNNAGFAMLIPAAILALFTGALRQRLRRTDGGSIAATTAAVAGGTIASGGLMVFAMAQIAVADASGHASATTMQTLNVLANNAFAPFIGGFGLLLVATGIAILQTRALPRTIAYIGIPVGVLVFTPLGWFAFLAGGLLMGATSVVMAVRPAQPAVTTRIVTPESEPVAVPS
jgi:hypothetical protein